MPHSPHPKKWKGRTNEGDRKEEVKEGGWKEKGRKCKGNNKKRNMTTEQRTE